MPEQSGEVKKRLHIRENLFRDVIAVLISSVVVATIVINITAPLKSIDFWDEYKLVKIGSTFTMPYSEVPDYFSRSKLEWTSSNIKNANVTAKGEINAVRVGIVTITVRGKNGISDSVTIEVCNDNC